MISLFSPKVTKRHSGKNRNPFDVPATDKSGTETAQNKKSQKLHNEVGAMVKMLKLKLNPPATFGRRAWNDNQRKAQGAIAKARKSWLVATGPKTIQGKKNSSRNAFKHGMQSLRVKKFRKLLTLQNQLLERLKKHERVERQKRRFVITMLKMGYRANTFKQFFEQTEQAFHRDPDYSRND